MERGVGAQSWQIVGTILFLIANLVNVLLAWRAIAAARGRRQADVVVGALCGVLTLPVAAALVLVLLGHPAWWAVVPPALLLIYFVIEFLLRYVWRLDFRGTPLFWPYIILYYLTLSSMAGLAFSLGVAYGFIYLFTYFVNLFLNWYAARHTRGAR